MEIIENLENLENLKAILNDLQEYNIKTNNRYYNRYLAQIKRDYIPNIHAVIAFICDYNYIATFCDLEEMTPRQVLTINYFLQDLTEYYKFLDITQAAALSWSALRIDANKTFLVFNELVEQSNRDYDYITMNDSEKNAVLKELSFFIRTYASERNTVLGWIYVPNDHKLVQPCELSQMLQIEAEQ